MAKKEVFIAIDTYEQLVAGDKVNILMPQRFGGGHLVGTYDGQTGVDIVTSEGNKLTVDLNVLLAVFNRHNFPKFQDEVSYATLLKVGKELESIDTGHVDRSYQQLHVLRQLSQGINMMQLVAEMRYMLESIPLRLTHISTRAYDSYYGE